MTIAVVPSIYQTISHELSTSNFQTSHFPPFVNCESVLSATKLPRNSAQVSGAALESL